MNAGVRIHRCLQILRRVAVLAALLVVAATGAASGQSINTNNVFAGYSFIGANLFSGQHANLNGWNISAEKKYLPFFGIVADFSGLYGSKNLPGSSICPAGSAGCLVHTSISEYTFDLGIRGSYGNRVIRPFGEALFGDVHTIENGVGLSHTNSNGFDAMLGAGIDCRLTRLFGCRVDVDYIVTGSFYARQNSIRASTGLVFRF
jgi:hypothetical protein